MESPFGSARGDALSYGCCCGPHERASSCLCWLHSKAEVSYRADSDGRNQKFFPVAVLRSRPSTLNRQTSPTAAQRRLQTPAASAARRMVLTRPCSTHSILDTAPTGSKLASRSPVILSTTTVFVAIIFQSAAVPTVPLVVVNRFNNTIIEQNSRSKTVAPGCVGQRCEK